MTSHKMLAATAALGAVFSVALPVSAKPLSPTAVARCVGYASELSDRTTVYAQDAGHMKSQSDSSPGDAKAKADYLKFAATLAEEVDLSTKVIARYYGGKPFPPGDARAHKARDEAIVAVLKACL